MNNASPVPTTVPASVPDTLPLARFQEKLLSALPQGPATPEKSDGFDAESFLRGLFAEGGKDDLSRRALGNVYWLYLARKHGLADRVEFVDDGETRVVVRGNDGLFGVLSLVSGTLEIPCEHHRIMVNLGGHLAAHTEDGRWYGPEDGVPVRKMVTPQVSGN